MTPKTRLRDGIPVVDAVADVTVFVTKADIRKGKQCDPCECAIAQAVKRTVGDTAEAQILRGIAYIKAPNETGEVVWHRYRLSPRTRTRVEIFDKTGEGDPAGYLLTAPSKTQTLDYKRKRKKTTKPGSRGRIRTGEKINLNEAVRNGAGSVHHVFA